MALNRSHIENGFKDLTQSGVYRLPLGSLTIADKAATLDRGGQSGEVFERIVTEGQPFQSSTHTGET